MTILQPDNDALGNGLRRPDPALSITLLLICSTGTASWRSCGCSPQGTARGKALAAWLGLPCLLLVTSDLPASLHSGWHLRHRLAICSEVQASKHPAHAPDVRLHRGAAHRSLPWIAEDLGFTCVASTAAP